MDLGASGDARDVSPGVSLSSVAAAGVVRFPPTQPPSDGFDGPGGPETAVGGAQRAASDSIGAPAVPNSNAGVRNP